VITLSMTAIAHTLARGPLIALHRAQRGHFGNAVYAWRRSNALTLETFDAIASFQRAARRTKTLIRAAEFGEQNEFLLSRAIHHLEDRAAQPEIRRNGFARLDAWVTITRLREWANEALAIGARARRKLR